MSMSKFFFVMGMTFALVVFVMNKSISTYLQQRYHIEFFPQSEILNEANSFKNKLEQIKNVLMNDEFSTHYEILNKLPENNKSITPAQQTLKYNTYEHEDIEFTPPQPLQAKKLDVKTGEEFLLIGDSLMQGVALALIKDLKQLGIKSTNLSKQNTGLVYKNYFDWVKAAQLSFESNDNIKYLVVLLGANDPWDITIKGKTYRFNSDEWKQIYTQRVDELIQIAKEYNVKILWYEIPPVKADTLNTKIQVLNEIFKQENTKNSEIFIDTANALSGGEKYSSYIRNENNASIKVRADDGIHFNLKGAKIMSKLLLEHISDYAP